MFGGLWPDVGIATLMRKVNAEAVRGGPCPGEPRPPAGLQPSPAGTPTATQSLSPGRERRVRQRLHGPAL